MISNKHQAMIPQLSGQVRKIKFISWFYSTKAIELSKKIFTSKRIYYSSLIVMLLFLVISSGCIEKEQKGYNVEENNYFLLVEEWHTTEGHIISGNQSDIPVRAIDFPMYYIQEGSKKIRVPFIQDNLKNLSNVSIIVGYGTSLDGDIGMGINSYLSTYEGFPLHINRSGYSIDIISNDQVLINNSIEIPPGGQHLIISNYTTNYGNTTVQIQHTIRIKNYGNYPKDSIYT